MARGLWLLILLSPVFGSEYSIYASFATKDFKLTQNQINISKTMTQRAKKAIFSCKLAANSQNESEFINSHKNEIYDCFSHKVNVKHFNSTNALIASEDTFISSQPLRFLLEFEGSWAKIYRIIE